MPIYSYRCQNGHIEDDFRPFSEIDDPYECSVCGENGVHVLNVEKIKVKSASNNTSGPATYFKFEDYKCLSCDTHFEFTKDTRKSETVVCPSCESQEVKLIPGLHGIDRFSERFPYYDRGLGMVLESKSHRRRICKERGLIPVDGDFDPNDMNAEARGRMEEDRRIMEKLQHDMKHHPAYAEYRRYKANGWNPNFKYRR